MKSITFLFLGIAVAVPVSIFAAADSQELHMYGTGEVHMRGANLERRNAINLYTVTLWDDIRWSVFLDSGTRIESIDGEIIPLEEILVNHRLEIRGRKIKKEVGALTLGHIDATLVRDLSVQRKEISIVVAGTSTHAVSPVQKPTVLTSPLAGTHTEVLKNNLRSGMRGKEVSVLQEFLQKNNWGIPNNGPVTGFFGSVTERALKKFQEANGLAAVGIADVATRERVNSLLKK